MSAPWGPGLDFRPGARPRLASGWALLALVLAALALGALAWQGLQAWRQQAQLQALQDDLARLRQQRERQRSPAITLPPAVRADALQAAQALSLPWGPLLEHLARHQVPEVALTQLEPDPRSGQLLLTGLSASPEVALGYARRLGDGGVLRQVQLLSHEPLATPSPTGLGTQWRLGARWTAGGAVPAEAAASQPADTPAQERP